MKIILYAEENCGCLFALPHKNSVDTIENKWLFPELYGPPYSFSGTVSDVKRGSDGLCVIPKSFGCEKLEIPGLTIEIEIIPVASNEKYRYKNLPIGGGGYVTGFAFSENNMLYCRTDIGGCYSCKPPYSRWNCLSYNAGRGTEWLCSPLALTCKNDILYVLFGNHSGSFLGISSDCGKSFRFHPIPAYVHGNCMGRSTGERIAVTSSRIFIGTRGGGLLCAEISDPELTWKKLNITAYGEEKLYIFKSREEPHKEIYASDDITFVRAFDNDTLIVGTAEGCGVYVTYNGGKSFSPLPKQPDSSAPFVSQRCAVWGDYLFITYSASDADRSFLWYSYGCDGSRLCDGRVYRYFRENGIYKFSADITPVHEKCGFSGVDISSNGEFLVCTTVCSSPDKIFLSRDYGSSWTEVLSNHHSSAQLFHTPYMKHSNNNGQSVIHWMSDIKIAPNDCKSAYINTGTGVFRTKNLGDKITVWEDFSDGMEETVHLGIYSPPNGNVRVIDVVGDLGGFSFTDIDKKCQFTFRDENHNRYITAINADFAEKSPNIAVISPRGNWIGTSKGGAALSFDGGISWRHLSDPTGINSHADSLIKRISQPNVNPGWVAISCDGSAIIRQIADRRLLPSDCSAVTFNYGETWSQIQFFADDGSMLTSSEMSVRIFSDRSCDNIFYAFGNGGEVFLSRDKGKKFTRMKIDGFLPKIDFSSIEEHCSPDIRVSPYNAGEIMVCFEEHGIFKLRLSDRIFISERIIPETDCSCALCGGFGKGGFIFFCGIYKGVYGFYRQLNGGWIKINSDDTQFGQIRSICGDPRAYGRFYIATGSFGALYGEIDIKKG